MKPVTYVRKMKEGLIKNLTEMLFQGETSKGKVPVADKDLVFSRNLKHPKVTEMQKVRRRDR